MSDTREAGANSPHLGEQEQGQAAKNAPLGPRVIHEIVREQGEIELGRTSGALAWSGFAAGLSMGFSFLVMGLIQASLPDAPWRHLVDSFGYSLGFVIVVLGRQQLFTESTLTAVLPVLTHPDRRTTRALLRLWIIVLLANVIGTFVFAALVSRPGLLRPEVYPALKGLARETVAAGFGVTLLKAVFAGWLIALMVWLLPPSRSARLFIILLLTYVVALGRFSHIIAGSAESAYGVVTGAVSLGAYFGAFLVPTLIGNLIGGVSLVAMLNHAPVATELEKPEE